LLEIIPSEKTSPETLEFLTHYGDLFLGKTPVQCKDTPAFIANRVGMFSIMAIFNLMKEMELTVEEIDTLTGPVSGKPKSATFRTSDIVGMDTLVKVANDIYENCPDDEQRDMFKVPDFANKLVENKWLGDKTGQGFYKKIKKDGKSEILALDIKTFEYQPKQKAKFATIGTAKGIDDLKERLAVLSKGKDKAGDFYRKFLGLLFLYVSHRIPEIADEVYKIDDAMRSGFAWEVGPFEHWDIVGREKIAGDDSCKRP